MNMECLIQFLNNEYQRELRNLAQCRSEKYEDDVEQYKKLFIKQLLYVKRDCTNQTCTYQKSCNVIKLRIYKENLHRIENFFNIVKKIYILWLDSKSNESFKKFNNLIELYKIDGFHSSIKNQMSFLKDG